MSKILTKRTRVKALVLALAAIACGIVGAKGHPVCLPIAATLLYMALSLLILRASAVTARSLTSFYVAMICLGLSIYFIIEIPLGIIDRVYYLTMAVFLFIETATFIIELIHNKLRNKTND